MRALYPFSHRSNVSVNPYYGFPVANLRRSFGFFCWVRWVVSIFVRFIFFSLFCLWLLCSSGRTNLSIFCGSAVSVLFFKESPATAGNLLPALPYLCAIFGFIQPRKPVKRTTSKPMFNVWRRSKKMEKWKKMDERLYRSCVHVADLHEHMERELCEA